MMGAVSHLARLAEVISESFGSFDDFKGGIQNGSHGALWQRLGLAVCG